MEIRSKEELLRLKKAFELNCILAGGSTRREAYKKKIDEIDSALKELERREANAALDNAVSGMLGGIINTLIK